MKLKIDEPKRPHFNWRKPVFHAAMSATGYSAHRHLQLLDATAFTPREELLRMQDDKLAGLLMHACAKVPYYRTVLSEAGVVKGGRVRLENFAAAPPLTKDIIRREGDNLYSADYKKRRCYFNTSGGSTGVPVRLVQDREFESWGFACRFYYNRMAGKDIGEAELLLWGSERDICGQGEKVSTRLRRWLFNKALLNSFNMSAESMDRYIRFWNRFRPKMVWAYTSSIYEFARYVRRTQATVPPPAAIVCTAETMTENVRRYVEEVFGCPVLNQYGSREVGPVACECRYKRGLHTFPLNHKLEILDGDLKPCAPGQMGHVYITTLNNFSMPLIRYSIGDTAIVSDRQTCDCGRTSPLIAGVTGRSSDHFKTRDGKLIHGEYFTHMFYGHDAIRRFRVVQHDYDDVEILAESEARIGDAAIADFQSKVRLAMGPDCRIAFRQVDRIPPTPSGKHRYTISEID